MASFVVRIFGISQCMECGFVIFSGLETFFFFSIKKGTANKEQELIPSAKYGVGSVRLWSCFEAGGSGVLINASIF